MYNILTEFGVLMLRYVTHVLIHYLSGLSDIFPTKIGLKGNALRLMLLNSDLECAIMKVQERQE